MAQRIRTQTGLQGGVEGGLSGLGKFLLALGIAGCIASFIVSGFATKTGTYDNWGENGLSPAWIAIALISLIQGIAAFYLFGGFAEVIRILKKTAGLPFGGHISKPEPLFELLCSECKSVAESYDEKCTKCGAPFTPSADTPPTVSDQNTSSLGRSSSAIHNVPLAAPEIKEPPKEPQIDPKTGRRVYVIE